MVIDSEKGDYGPYTQSKREEIYKTVAKSLVLKGLAYPCFCTAEELTALRDRQEKDGALIRGYFGKYAKCRNLTYEEIEKNIKRASRMCFVSVQTAMKTKELSLTI